MLFREMLTVYCVNHTKHKYTVLVEFMVFNVKACGAYSYHFKLIFIFCSTRVFDGINSTCTIRLGWLCA
jgi:hypothetical protein